jgi:hypothetical protein
MKNIHVLATPNPSRLAIHRGILKYNSPSKKATDFQLINRSMLPQNIYITNDEETKGGDWCFEVYNEDSKATTPNFTDEKGNKWWLRKANANDIAGCPTTKKIILTTDPELIADGVQAIDDEFLEWFVKNPSCEWVEVEKTFITNSGLGYQEYAVLNSDFKVLEINTKIPQTSYYLGKVTILNTYEYVINYKIIIPKEEPSPLTVGKEFYESADKNITVYRQETLEEAKKKFAYTHKKEGDTAYEFGRDMYSFDKCAKWQSEQSKNKYSEEEVIQLVSDWTDYRMSEDSKSKVTFKKWFEKFKK